MIGRAAAALVALAVATGLTAVSPAGACACGIALEAEVTGERALVVDQPGYEQGEYVTRMQVDAADPATFDEDLVLEDAAPGAGDPEGLSGLANGIQPGANDEGAADDGDELSVVAIALIVATVASVLAAAIAYRAHRDD